MTSPDGARLDVIDADGRHTYWSTHCRHDRHDDCSASEVRGTATRFAGNRGTWPVTTERKPAQCKTCAAPCVCDCHGRRYLTRDDRDAIADDAAAVRREDVCDG